jgi:hypothetical protein
LVLTGTGAHGAYHAGALRALQEAGVKIDLVAGHGIGAGGAALAAIDGSARLWEKQGVWRGSGARSMYSRRWSLRGTGTRRMRGGWWWRFAGAPLDARGASERFAAALWVLIRGAAPLVQPGGVALGRRFSEVLVENLGQPGFREVLLVATDLDARRDMVAALLSEPYRQDFLAPRVGVDRRSEVLDLCGVGRDHALDMIAAGLTPPLVSDPHLMTFASDSFWRGETHRVCDRPGALQRLLEEVAAAGVRQVIIVTGISPTAAPHRLRAARLDVRGRYGEFQTAAEAVALRDGIEAMRIYFDSIYVVQPAHNAIGPYDLRGAYDDASDRHQDVSELLERAYEDTYRQFIEPVVGASGELLARRRLSPDAHAI